MAGQVTLRSLGLSLLVLLVLPSAAIVTASPAPTRSVFAPVVIYHHIKLQKPSDNAIERGLTVFPDQFADQLHYLTTHGYHIITAAALVYALRSRQALPPKPVVLTFDDGYIDMYADVYRALRSLHLTATFFIVPGFLGSPRYLTWAQVIDMSRHGMDIEAHSMSHSDLTKIPTNRLPGEVGGSRRVLEGRLHRQIALFAYPYGDYNAAVLTAVGKAGFAAAFTTRQGWIQTSTSLLILPRVYIDQDDTIPIFAGRLRADPLILAQDPA